MGKRLLAAPAFQDNYAVLSFQELLAGLPSLTVEERQLLLRRTVELDDAVLSPAEEKLVEERRAEYRRDPASGFTLDEIEKRIRAKLGPRCGT